MTRPFNHRNEPRTNADERGVHPRSSAFVRGPLALLAALALAPAAAAAQWVTTHETY